MSDHPAPKPMPDQLEFYSCFISYAHTQDEFAEKLHNDLEQNGVSCWKDSHDMSGGQAYRTQIVRAIRNNAKLIVVCSEVSVSRDGVIEEVVAAMNRQRETHTQKLFPLRLDDFVLSKDMLDMADAKMDEGGVWTEDWVRYIRAFHIPDFSQWQDEAAYQQAFAKLLRDLQQPPTRH